MKKKDAKKVNTLEEKIDAIATTLGHIAVKMDKQFASVNQEIKTLDKRMDKGFAGQATYFKSEIEKLATSTAKGFVEIEMNMATKDELADFRHENKQEHENFREQVNGFDSRLRQIEDQNCESIKIGNKVK